MNDLEILKLRANVAWANNIAEIMREVLAKSVPDSQKLEELGWLLKQLAKNVPESQKNPHIWHDSFEK
jgi:hypothetical protein